ncbi:MAG TPA: hypothetical protein VG889_20505 [Rhizomicrobium sp.]|nr:hypothetical protein [Rhizomicrobium sp.]
MVALSRELSARSLSLSGVLAQPARRLQKAAAAASRKKDPTIKKSLERSKQQQPMKRPYTRPLKAALERSFEFDQLKIAGKS